MSPSAPQSVPVDPTAARGAQPPRVSVVIVSWNALEVVKSCLPSVVDTDYPNLEIVFADNGSDDGTVDWIEGTFPNVVIVRHPENWAFCRGNNRAVEQASGDIVVLLNNDVEVPRDWLRPLVARLLMDRSIGAVQPKLLDRKDPARFEYAGAAGGFLDRNGYPFARGRVFFTVEVDTGQYDESTECFWATGAAMATWKSLYDRLGGLDERLVMHMEEIDFCWRLQREGYRIVCEPESRVFHVGGASLAAGSPRKVYLNYRNNLLVLYKNLPRPEWARVLVRRVFLDTAGAIRAALLGRWRETAAIARAYVAAHRMKKRFAAERPGKGDRRILPTYRGSIVLDYFLRAKKTFRSLPDRFT